MNMNVEKSRIEIARPTPPSCLDQRGRKREKEITSEENRGGGRETETDRETKREIHAGARDKTINMVQRFHSTNTPPTPIHNTLLLALYR